MSKEAIVGMIYKKEMFDDPDSPNCNLTIECDIDVDNFELEHKRLRIRSEADDDALLLKLEMLDKFVRRFSFNLEDSELMYELEQEIQNNYYSREDVESDV